MAYGRVEYDEDGNPICEYCKKSFKRVLTHVRQKHGVTEREYKLQFGLELSKGICSAESAGISSLRAYDNYNKVIAINLINKGRRTRFKKGDPGRTADMVQEQTRIALVERLKQPYMQKAMKKSGRKLGKSGLGNQARWGNKKGA